MDELIGLTARRAVELLKKGEISPLELIDAIEKAIKIKGFTLVEAISPCPTQFGRRNAMGDLAEMYETIDAACISPDAAAIMSEDERLRHFTVGEFE